MSERVIAASVCEPAIRAASVSERAAWVTAALLVVCGVAVYAPMPAISGRYTMPAVWGLDIAFAGLLTKLAGVPLVAWRRSAVVGIAGGLVAVAIANVGRQDKFAARAALLWQALETVEWTAEPGERVAWVSGPALNVEEGIHFRWHLAARGNDTEVELIDATGTAVSRVELPAARGGATLAVTGTPNPPTNGAWALRDKFERRYWGGRRHYDCYLWTTAGAVARDGR